MDSAGADPAPGPLESEQGERGRRLAAAGLAHQSERLSVRELERRAVDDVVPAVVRPEVDRQPLDLDERLLLHLALGALHVQGRHGVRSTVRPRARAIPSVTRLRLITSSASATDGASTVRGAVTSAARFSLIISPHSGDGGRAPKPRKPSELIRIGA